MVAHVIIMEVISVIEMLRKVNDQVVANKSKSCRLIERVQSIVPSLNSLIPGSTAMPTESLLRKLHQIVKDILDFTTKFTVRNYLIKAWQSNTDQEQFASFTSDLNQCIHDLQLGITVDVVTQARENHDDQKEDLEVMKNLVIEILTSQGFMQQKITEIIHNLEEKELRQINVIEDIHREYRKDKKQIIDILYEINNISNKNNNAAPNKPQLPQLKTITRNQLDFDPTADESYLGEGSFGKVYKGSYMGSPVAIKLISPPVTRSTADSTKAKNEMHREALTMQLCNFPGVIHFFGAQLESVPRFIVMELAICSLYDVLHTETHMNVFGELTLPVKLSLLAEISGGFAYLHSIFVTHRDIKSMNILVSENLRMKITDFGLAKTKELSLSVHSTKLNKGGTVAYIAPEILLENEFDCLPDYGECSDMYAMGVLMNEVLCRAVPFEALSMQKVIGRLMKDPNSRPTAYGSDACDPTTGDGITLELQATIARCWATDPVRRLTFDQLNKTINMWLSAMGGNPRRMASVRVVKDGDLEAVHVAAEKQAEAQKQAAAQRIAAEKQVETDRLAEVQRQKQGEAERLLAAQRIATEKQAKDDQLEAVRVTAKKQAEAQKQAAAQRIATEKLAEAQRQVATQRIASERAAETERQVSVHETQITQMYHRARYLHDSSASTQLLSNANSGSHLAEGYLAIMSQAVDSKHFVANQENAVTYAQRGISWLTARNSKYSNYILAVFSSCGLGIAKNDINAFRYYMLSASQGFVCGQYGVGYCYEFGMGVTVNLAEAYRFYRVSADQGFAFSEYAAARCLEQGIGTQVDLRSAFVFYKRAADQGLDRAQWRTGVCYKTGKGIGRNITEYKKYTRMAASQNHKEAMAEASKFWV